MRLVWLASLGLMLFLSSCHQNKAQADAQNPDSLFVRFQGNFLDAYWKSHPSYGIEVGYDKYAGDLIIPDSLAFANESSFARNWLDSLRDFQYSLLSPGARIDYKIIQNQLESEIWYIDSFKINHWDPSAYNLGSDAYTLLTRQGTPLNERLQVLSRHITKAPEYFAAAMGVIYEPTREYTELAIRQNKGSLDIFGKMISDSIDASTLSAGEKDTLRARAARAQASIRSYIQGLEKMLVDRNYHFRDFRIGKALFHRKFALDLVTDVSPEEIYAKADSAKRYYHQVMYGLAKKSWPKYFPGAKPPEDSLALIRQVLGKIALRHALPKDAVDSATYLVQELKKFIVEKKLFDYDTSHPLVVRIMPAYMAGVSLANAEFTPPYLQTATTFYNVSDLSTLPPAAAESELREYNNYSLGLLSIHEGIPGHCLQGVYNSQSGSRTRSVFQNGAMTEGWAVYTEQMMVENGWGANSPEIWLTLYKWRLRELSNVLVDYSIQCLGASRADIFRLLKEETFQEDSQIDEKYHRATVSQVQLCSYFTGWMDILELRKAYQQKMGSAYSLRDFHEQFLHYGSAPVSYIREMMM